MFVDRRQHPAEQPHHAGLIVYDQDAANGMLTRDLAQSRLELGACDRLDEELVSLEPSRDVCESVFDN